MNPDISAIQKVELAIAQCETLSILPSAAARFLSQLGRMELTPAALAELIESDPCFTALILRLCQNKAITIKQTSSWIQQVLEGVSLREIRDAVLSAKIYGGLSTYANATADRSDEPRTAFRRELTRHSLGVACCAEQLARLATPPLETPAAYLAGLLHDTGKFLLDEVMPKSFDTLLEQARSRKAGFATVEQENLGTDHAILGKRFAQKLHLPSDIILGVWLHHSQTGAISLVMPQARIAAVVELADCIVRRLGLGESGSYDSEDGGQRTEDRYPPYDTIADSLGLTSEQTAEVEKTLPEIVSRKSELAGLTLLRPGWAYFDALRTLTSELVGESAKLNEEIDRLACSAGQFDFIKELLPKISPMRMAIELAEDIAVDWQKFYQTGPVCVYLVGSSTTPGNDSKTVEAVVIDPDAPGQPQPKMAVLNVPDDIAVIPESANPGAPGFAVLDAADYADWLSEQLDVEFDRAGTRMASLCSDGKTVGVIVFELRQPAKGDITERFAETARFAAVSLDMLETIGRQQWFAERFAQLLATGGRKTEDRRQRTEDETQNIEHRTSNVEREDGRKRGQSPFSEVLTEMAAGAAHELNNPLSVIKGRAQLLAGSETDADKKRVLEQIQQNANELSAIIDDLMSYANPQTPTLSQTPVRQIIDGAIDLAGRKALFSRPNIKIDVSPDIPNVRVDSAQIAIAISNIICNALESDDTQAVSVTIKATHRNGQGKVIIEVIDAGRGMDEQTLSRATQPFFSARPAGRKRGMGLAHAQRLIQINGGTLEITSQPAKGTTVTLTLPCSY